MDPLQWMGAVRMRDQTADKNITDQNIQTAPIHCRGSIHWLINFSKSVLIKKQTHLHIGWLEGKLFIYIYTYIYIYGVWTIPFTISNSNMNFCESIQLNHFRTLYPSTVLYTLLLSRLSQSLLVFFCQALSWACSGLMGFVWWDLHIAEGVETTETCADVTH